MAIVKTSLEHLRVSLVDSGLLRELRAEHLRGAFERAVKEPAEEAESEDVAAFEDTLGIHSLVRERGLCHRGNGHFHHLGSDAEFLDRVVGLEFSLFQTFLLEGIDVDNNNPAGLHRTVVLLESRGVHRHKHVATVAGGMHSRTDANLEAADTAERPLRGAYLSGIVGEG